MANIRRRYKEAWNNRKKSTYANLCACKLLTHYYEIDMMKVVLGISSKRLQASTLPPTSRGHKHATRRILRRKHLVQEFLILDESLACSRGKKTRSQEQVEKAEEDIV